MSKVRLATVTMTLALVGAGLTACSQDRWCELDATDTKVADRYCEQNTPGYEWEPDGDGKTKVKKKKKR